tara:strand:+ start:6194 stop:7060 length:867 start_codon:yes stop_codon:yes gene_type:complete
MQKRASISLFVIAGLILLISVSLIYYIESITKERSVEEQSQIISGATETAEITKFVENCLSGFGKEAAYIIGSNGGYLSFSSNNPYQDPGNNAEFYEYYYVDNKRLPVLVNAQNTYQRSKEVIEQMISNYVTVNLPSCINNLSLFKVQGFNISYPHIELGNPESKVEVIIQPSVIRITLNWPLLVKRNNIETDLTKFVAPVETRLGFLLSVADQLATDISLDRPFNLFANCNKYMNQDPLINLYVESNPYTYEYIIKVVDTLPLQSNEPPLKFEFAVRNREILGECIG